MTGVHFDHMAFARLDDALALCNKRLSKRRPDFGDMLNLDELKEMWFVYESAHQNLLVIGQVNKSVGFNILEVW